MPGRNSWVQVRGNQLTKLDHIIRRHKNINAGAAEHNAPEAGSRRGAGVLRAALLGTALCLGPAFILLPATDIQAASPIPSFDRPAPGTQMRLRSNSIDYDRSGRVAIAIGDVVINYGGYELTADRVSYDRRRGKLTARGNVRLKEPGGTVFTADDIELSDSFRDAFANRLSVLLTNEAVLTAQTARREAGNVTTYTNATYTRCKACEDDPNKPLVWLIKADKITHNKQERELTYEGASFEFLGNQLLKIPRFAHADPTVRRRTGFLAPVFSTSDEFGFGVGVPFFWAIAPHYDVTFRPLLTTKQGPVFDATWRHRIWNGAYSVRTTGLYEFNEDNDAPGNSRWRGAIQTKGKFHINEYWKWGWDATLVSDDTFLRRYNLNDSTDIVSQAYLTGLKGRNYFDARAYHFRGVLATDDNDQSPYVLPVIDHQYYLDVPVLGGEVNIESNFTHLHRERGSTTPLATDFADWTRLTSTLHWERHIVTGVGAVLTPFARVRGDVFHSDNDNRVDPITGGPLREGNTKARFFPTAGIDVRMPFISSSWTGVQQIFEPVAQLLVRPKEINVNDVSNEDSRSFEFEETNLFDYNKFSGIDRWEGGTRANIGFNHTILFNDGNYAKLTVGESFHLAGRNSFGARAATKNGPRLILENGLGRDKSDFVAALQLKPTRNLQFVGRVRVDEKSGNLKRTDVSSIANFGPIKTLIHFTDADSQRFADTNHQTEIYSQASIALNDRWTAFGDIRYDIKDSQRIENTAGIRYDDQCFVFQVAYKEDFTGDRDIDKERSVKFSFSLKTVTSGFGGDKN